MIKKNMKFYIFVLLAGILLSCSKNNNNNNSDDSNTSSANGTWRFKMDGVQYQWISLNDPFNLSSSTFSENSSMTEIELWNDSPLFSFTFKISTLNTGTYFLNNYNAFLTYHGSSVTYYTDASNIITLNITEINNNVTPNIIKGTFSGKLTRENNQGEMIVKNITEGYFEAIRE
jgi:hypothetical protein